MRVFQLITFGQSYLRPFEQRTPQADRGSYASLLSELLDDRYCNAHVLLPVLEREERACFVVADSALLQNTWQAEHGVKNRATTEQIVLSQIEEHRSEVFYNISPLLFDSRFVRRLPACVKHTVCWRAAPLGDADLCAYSLRVSNFRLMLDEWTRLGQKAAWFEPAHDPIATKYAHAGKRDIDVAFVGSYSWLHRRRNELLQRVARLSPSLNVRFHFSFGRSTRIANALGPARRLVPNLVTPEDLRRVSHAPVYGRAMYETFGRARIVLNAAIDMAGGFRGNMRCWEAMGCGALMLSDDGIYPPGMSPGKDFVTYTDASSAVSSIKRILANYADWRPIADQGLATMESAYSKSRQWASFVRLVENL